MTILTIVTALLIQTAPAPTPAPAPPTAQAPVWQSTAPSPLVLAEGRAVPLLVTVLSNSVTKPQLVHSSLREATTGGLIRSDDFALCAAPPRWGCRPPDSLSKGSHQLYLVVSDSFDRPGEFRGSVYLQVNEKPDPLAVELTVYGSPGWSALKGWVTIAFGVLLSLLGSVYLRQYSARLDALAPAALLVTYIDDLGDQVTEAGEAITFGYPRLTRRLSELRQDLSEAALEARGYLPARLRNPFGVDADQAAYKTYLSTRSDQIAAVTVIVGGGLPAISEAWKKKPNDSAIVIARDALDALPSTVSLPADATAAVDRILATMHAALLPVGGAGLARSADSPATRSRSILDIRAGQTRIALASWMVLALVNVVAGGTIFILMNHGFGVGLDYVKCFFWGLGVQSAGQQVQQLTPAGIATSLKLSLPA